MKFKLSDFAKVGSSKRIYAKEYRKSGIPFYRGKEIIAKSEGRKVDNVLFISKDKYNDLSKRASVPQENDILISAVGTIGKIYHVDQKDIPFYFKDGNLIRIYDYNLSLIDPYYLYYLLKSNYAQDKIKKIEIGSTQKAITIKDISNMKFDIPSLKKQQEVARIPKLIDTRIKLNDKINDNLLELSRNIFKKFFPNVNEGIDTIGNYIKNYDKYRKPLSKKQRNQMPGMYRYIGATSVNDYINKYNFNGIYLLLGEDGTVQDDKGYPILQYIHGKFWPNNHAHVLQGKVVSTEWLYLFFLQKNIQEIVTGAVQKKISQKNLNSLKVNIPNENELKNFDDFIQPIFKKIRILEDENIALEKLKQQFLNQFF